MGIFFFFFWFQNMVAEIALKWTQLLRTGALGVKFMGIDLGTIMFNLEDGHKVLEVNIRFPCSATNVLPSFSHGNSQVITIFWNYS